MKRLATYQRLFLTALIVATTGGARAQGLFEINTEFIPAPLPQEIISSQNIRFSDVQKRIFDQSSTQCHSATKQKGKVNLSSYDSIMKNSKKVIVIPGSPEESLVYTEIFSESMPPKGPAVSPEDLAMLKQWILEGAVND